MFFLYSALSKISARYPLFPAIPRDIFSRFPGVDWIFAFAGRVLRPQVREIMGTKACSLASATRLLRAPISEENQMGCVSFFVSLRCFHQRMESLARPQLLRNAQEEKDRKKINTSPFGRQTWRKYTQTRRSQAGRAPPPLPRTIANLTTRSNDFRLPS